MKSNQNKINFQITYSFHQTFWWTMFRQKIVISKFESRSTWKNCTNCVITCHNSLIYKTSLKSTLSHCRWKNGCNGRWKKWCRESEHTINSIFIEIMNAAKRLKKWKNYVKYLLIHKTKKIEKFIFMQMTTNKKSYAKQKFWNFKKQLIQMSWIKKNCDLWSNESKSKIMFWMNCQKCSRWLKTCRKMLTKNWQHFLNTKHGFWSMNFFRFHFRLIWVIFLAQRIWCWCITQQSLQKKMIKIMKKLNSNKTFKLNNIINWFLKICENGLINVLTSFFQTCVNQKYHFKMYQKNNTIILRKSDKNNYDVVKTWCSIILLNMINKIFKSIINKKLLYLAKYHDWLFITQIKIQLNKLTKIILKFLIKQMHTMWKTEINKIATLLNMNVTKNFSMINYIKLIYNLQKKNIQLNY